MNQPFGAIVYKSTAKYGFHLASALAKPSHPDFLSAAIFLSGDSVDSRIGSATPGWLRRYSRIAPGGVE
jgi:hypothetical protein